MIRIRPSLSRLFILLPFLALTFTVNAQCDAIPWPEVDVDSPEYAQVILDDPFCCDGEWDGICQGAYDELVGGPPPANDLCASAATAMDGTTPFSALSATGTALSLCGTEDTRDIWFVYVASCTGTATVNTCDSNYDTVLSMFDACGGTEVECNDDDCGAASQISFAVTEGTSYYIRIAGYLGGTGYGDLFIECSGTAGCVAIPPITVDTESEEYAQVITDDPFCCDTEWDDICQTAYDILVNGGDPPANDECADAIEVSDGETEFTNIGATGIALSSCGFEDDTDVWFTYEASCDGVVMISTCGSGFDTILALYDACDGSEVDCNDDACGLQSQLFVETTAGTVYWIRIAGYEGAVGNGLLTISCSAPPANDECADAIEVSDGETEFTTLGATGTATSSCGSDDTADIWFTYEASCTGTVMFSTCGSGFDTVLSLFDACDGTEVDCNDDACGAGSQLFVETTVGTVYWIRIAGFGGAMGDGILTISCSEPATNDECADAIVIGNGETEFNTLGATGSSTSSCGFDDTADIWFEYVATCNGTAVANTCGSEFDTVLSAFDACDGSEIACNDDFCGLQSQVTFPVTEGMSYWIRVAGYDGEMGIGVLTLACVLEGECIAIPPPEVDTESTAYQEVIDENADCCDVAWDLTCQQSYDILVGSGAYCAAFAGSQAFEKISNVTFAGIDNDSESFAGYENFQDVVGNVEQGVDYPISISVSNGFPEDQVLVWIDFDHSDSFEPSELVFTSTISAGPLFEGTVSVPMTATTGNTRMRVRLHDTHDGTDYDNEPNATPCGLSTYGQVEDYTITIDMGVGLEDMNAASWSVFPNPNDGDFTIRYAGIDALGTLDVFDMTGRRVYDARTAMNNGQYVTVSLHGKLAPGSYILRFSTENGRHEERIIVR